MSEKDITRAEQERYDLEAIVRMRGLMVRFGRHQLLFTADQALVQSITDAMQEELRFLLDKEGL